MLRRLTLVLTLMAMVGLITAPAVAAAPPGRGLLSDIPVTGTLNGADWEGTLTVNEITREGGQLLADVSLVGEGVDVGGLVPVEVGAACDILNLDLGPLNLDLLGLVIDLSAISLDITAVPGPGNLLGNLLCAVAGLLDGPNPIGGLIDRLLGLINNLLG